MGIRGRDLFGFFTLHARMFDIAASESTARGIIDAIRVAYAARLAAQNTLLDGGRFCSPVLLVTSQSGADCYALAGAATSLDPTFESLVARGDVKIDQALELMILLTCHSKPGESAPEKWERCPAPSHIGENQKSAFAQPFHRKRFKQVMSALRARAAGDSFDERRAMLYRLLSSKVQDVIESASARIRHVQARSCTRSREAGW